MQVGGSGSLRSDINVTPLVDVVLVLLIIFMVITPVVQMGYLVRVPPKAPANLPPSAVQDQIILRLMPNNVIFINKEEVPEANFPSRVHDILHGNTSKMVFFSGSRDVDYEATMKFLDMAREAGCKNIGIIVEEAQ
ncbi:MAG TPA: biopolymer transporter ExbD [Thermoanaerobaculia bacterium]|nr:biopolymer transporter ExbD [Thermoanaerobaculia bacterium]